MFLNQNVRVQEFPSTLGVFFRGALVAEIGKDANGDIHADVTPGKFGDLSLNSLVSGIVVGLI